MSIKCENCNTDKIEKGCSYCFESKLDFLNQIMKEYERLMNHWESKYKFLKNEMELIDGHGMGSTNTDNAGSRKQKK